MSDRVHKLIDRVPPNVRQLFEELTFQLIGIGFTHYSADAVLHRIRWHMNVDVGDKDFKCNNNWTAYLSRWFAERHPQYASFFSFRRLGGGDHNSDFFR